MLAAICIHYVVIPFHGCYKAVDRLPEVDDRRVERPGILLGDGSQAKLAALLRLADERTPGGICLRVRNREECLRPLRELAVLYAYRLEGGCIHLPGLLCLGHGIR